VLEGIVSIQWDLRERGFVLDRCLAVVSGRVQASWAIAPLDVRDTR
jgi:hypothetical protein